MASSGKFSVLFMRDDSDVRRYRINMAWFKVGIVAIIILICLATAGIALSIHYWSMNDELVAQNTKLLKEASDLTVRLERLENVEKIGQESISDPRDLLATARQEEKWNSKNSETTDSALSESSANQTEEPDATYVAEPDNKTVANNSSSLPSWQEDLSSSGAIDQGLVKIENLNIKVSDKRFSVAFNLLNSGKRSPLAGKVTILISTRDRGFVEAEVKKSSDLDFQIQRYKRIRADLSLPEGLEANNILGVRIDVLSAKEELLFSHVYQSPDWHP